MIHHKTFNRKGLLLLLLLTFSVLGYSQDTGSSTNLSAGLRFNNPFGFSIKKYWNDNAMELVVGRANPWRYNGYYRFRRKYEKNGYHYVGFDPVYKPLVLQAHFTKQLKVNKVPQLSFYYGGGVQLRNYNYYLNYSYEKGGVTHYESYREHNLGVGVDALAGLEFRFKSIPFVLFYDLTLYTEMIQMPLFMNFDSSWGLRYYW